MLKMLLVKQLCDFHFVCDLIVSVLQVLYREDFEKNKGKGFSVVADTPELQRIKKTQDQISNVSVSNGVKKNSITPVRCFSSKCPFLPCLFVCFLNISFILLP